MSNKITSQAMKIAGGILLSFLIVNSASADFSFEVDGKVGRIDSNGRTYDNNGVYQGDYDFSRGVYTGHDGGTVDVNNTPGIKVYDNGGMEVPKVQAPPAQPPAASSTDFRFEVDGKVGRITADGKTYDNNGVYQGNYNFTTGIYTGNDGGTVDVNNTPSVKVYNSVGVEVVKTPTTSTPGSNLQGDYQAYWDGVSPGTIISIAGGTVTRNADGTATYKNGNYTYTYNKNTPMDEVAKNIPMLGQEWAKTYDYKLPDEIAKTDFNDFESYKAWEKRVTANAHFASGYQTPDYIKMMGLAQGGGDDEAFKRYLFFKTNPQYAEDYARIYQGQLSRFETDSSTIIKTDLSQLPAKEAEYYKNNPADLRAAEGFGMDPVLARKVYTGEIKLPYGTNATEWLQYHKWTPNGIVENNNKVDYAKNQYIGMDGKGAKNYQRLTYDTATGYIVDLDGTLYDSVTGEVKGKVDPNTFYGSGGVVKFGATSNGQTYTGTPANKTPTTTTPPVVTNNTSATGTTTTTTPPIADDSNMNKIGFGNVYGLTLSESTANKLQIFVQKVVAKQSKFSSNTEYVAFLNKLSTKLSAAEANQKYENNTTIKNSIKFLILEIGKIRVAVSGASNKTSMSSSIVDTRLMAWNRHYLVQEKNASAV